VVGPALCTAWPRTCRGPLASRCIAQRCTPSGLAIGERARRPADRLKLRIGTTTATPRLSARRASWLVASWPALGTQPPPTKASMGVAGMQLVLACPGHLCPDASQLQTGTGTVQSNAISTAARTAVIFSFVDRSMASSDAMPTSVPPCKRPLVVTL
jgi:hypothetical protein